MIPYIKCLREMGHFCEEFRSGVIDLYFTGKNNEVLSESDNHFYCWTPRYQQQWQKLSGSVEICDMFGISCLEHSKSLLTEKTTSLNNPLVVEDRLNFELLINHVRSVFKQAEKEIERKLQFLDREEEIRLDEALNCWLEGCYYSAVAMSVSAIEFRLLSLMMSKYPNTKLEDLTLGQLIREYMNDKKKFGNIIPKKHEPLLELCNNYRIFSVHPKRESITKSIATSIINMTLSFLLDESMRHKTETNEGERDS